LVYVVIPSEGPTVSRTLVFGAVGPQFEGSAFAFTGAPSFVSSAKGGDFSCRRRFFVGAQHAVPGKHTWRDPATGAPSPAPAPSVQSRHLYARRSLSSPTSLGAFAGLRLFQPTAYFVTICTQDKRRIFGAISGHAIELNVVGKIVERCWLELPSHFAAVELGSQVIMPNHLHGIVRLLPPEANGALVAEHVCRAQHAVPLRPEPARRFAAMAANSIPAIVRSFKSAATAAIRTSLGRPRVSVWQRGYHEHVIRDEEDFRNTCEYIRMNPARWEFDEENS
jgi:REP element-mobilizing transposase RayT